MSDGRIGHRVCEEFDTRDSMTPKCRSEYTLLPTGVVFFGLKVFGSLRHDMVAPICVTQRCAMCASGADSLTSR